MTDLKPKTASRPSINTKSLLNSLSGIALLFVCVSIGYANYVVFFGTNDLVSKIMLIPSSLFVLVFLVHKAVK
jgi:hypothetical protein